MEEVGLMSAVRLSVQLVAMFVVGLGAGIWTFVAPWALGYPVAGGHAWTSSTWANIWVGVIVIGASALALTVMPVVVLGGAAFSKAQHKDAPGAG
jgi:hypothetical protein